MTLKTISGIMSMKTDSPSSMSRSRQQGFSLLEVLIAMLILGVAVMGFAGLQVRALQSTGVAHVRSQAMALATDTSERIRANRTPAALGTYLTATNWTTALPANAPSTWSGTCVLTSTSSNGCSDIQMAQFDIREVRYIASQVLPNGTVNVSSCDGGVLVLCVAVAWGSEKATTCSGNADTSGECVMMKVMPL